MICEACWDDIVSRSSDGGRASAKCPECGKTFYQFEKGNQDEDRTLSDFADVEVDDDLKMMESKSRDDSSYITVAGRKIKGHVPRSKRKSYLGDDHNGWQPEAQSSASKWLNLCDSDPTKPITPSAKTTAALELIQKWQQTAPSDKIVVFIKWTMTAKVLGRMLQSKKIPFVYYFGGRDSSNARQKALEAFETNDKIKVMVCPPVV